MPEVILILAPDRPVSGSSVHVSYVCFSPDLAPFSQFILISYGIPWLVSSLLITSVGLVITEKVIEHGVFKALMRKRIRLVFKSPGVPYRIPFSYFFSIFLQNIAKRSQGELATVASGP